MLLWPDIVSFIILNIPKAYIPVLLVFLYPCAHVSTSKQTSAWVNMCNMICQESKSVTETCPLALRCASNWMIANRQTGHVPRRVLTFVSHPPPQHKTYRQLQMLLNCYLLYAVLHHGDGKQTSEDIKLFQNKGLTHTEHYVCRHVINFAKT